MRSAKAEAFLRGRERNSRVLDIWSLVHFGAGAAAGWVMAPWLAVLVLVLWEPLEVFVLSPILAHFGFEFGHESWRNVLSDIVADLLGLAVGVLVLRDLWGPPFLLG